MSDKIKHQFETFLEIGPWQVSQLTRTTPSAMNHHVMVRRYRVTVEEIDEPDEIIRDRIRELCWDCVNHNEWGALQAMAREYGMDSSAAALDFGRNSKTKKKKGRKKK